MTKRTVDPKVVKVALKVVGLVLAIATAVVAQWETGAITDAASFVVALAQAVLTTDGT